MSRINYPIHTMRLSDELWHKLRMRKFIQKLTWNQLLAKLLALDSEQNKDNISISDN